MGAMPLGRMGFVAQVARAIRRSGPIFKKGAGGIPALPGCNQWQRAKGSPRMVRIDRLPVQQSRFSRLLGVRGCLQFFYHSRCTATNVLSQAVSFGLMPKYLQRLFIPATNCVRQRSPRTLSSNRRGARSKIDAGSITAASTSSQRMPRPTTS